MAEIWWNKTLATPAEKYWSQHGAPKRGQFGGACAQAGCTNGTANWLNRASGDYYCEGCARAVNEICAAEGRAALCCPHE